MWQIQGKSSPVQAPSSEVAQVPMDAILVFEQVGRMGRLS
jgi:hypothetical protein